MCSGAIYQGVDIGTLHYNFTKTAQGDLEKIARNISSGQLTFLYRADNEIEQRTYTADVMKVIIKVQDEWISVNTLYYELLQKWINRETDETIINDIHYGSLLPDYLTQELVTKLASVGIDATKYANMFS
jgi:hypothetical protein